MSDFFHEVEEDLRRDQALALWNKYGNLMVGAVLVLILAVAGQWGWTKYTTHQRLQASADFLAAGCSALGVGGSLVSSEILKNQDWPELTRRAAAFITAARSVRPVG